MSDLKPFDKLKADITIYCAPAMLTVVSDKESQDNALIVAKEIASYEKRVEEKRKELIAPLLEQQRAINEYAKEITGPLMAAKSHVKTTLIAWDKKLEAIRQEEFKKLQEKKEQQQKEAAQAAQKAREEAEAKAMFSSEEDSVRKNLVVEAEAQREEKAIEIMARVEEKAIAANSVKGIRKIWKFRVTDSLAVDRDFLTVDERALTVFMRRVLDANDIPVAKGVEFYQEATLGVR